MAAVERRYLWIVVARKYQSNEVFSRNFSPTILSVCSLEY